MRDAARLFLALLFPASAHATDLPTGDWRSEGLAPEESARVEASVQAAVSALAAPLRPVARAALRRAARPCDRVRIERVGEAVSVRCDALPPAVAVPGAEATWWTGEDGRTHALTYEFHDGALVQRLVASRGAKTTRFVSDGGTLRAVVTIESELLSSDIAYTITYR